VNGLKARVCETTIEERTAAAITDGRLLLRHLSVTCWCLVLASAIVL
jgi:hypothetical protein